MTADSSHADALAQHVLGLRALARLLVANADERDDLLQEAFLLAQRQRLPQAGGERSWLLRILKNLSRSRFRSAERRVRREALAAKPVDGVPPSVDLAARREMLEVVTRSVLELDPPLRDAVLLCFFEGRRQEEAARALGITVRVLRHRTMLALRELRKRLDRALGNGDRWGHSLCLLLGIPSPIELAGAAILGGGIAMKKVLALGAALLLLGLSGWWMQGALRDAGESAGSAPPELASRTTDDAADERSRVNRSVAPAAPEASRSGTEGSIALAAPPPRVISGTVISQRRLPVEGAVIACWLDGQRTVSTTSVASGAFRFELSPELARSADLAEVHAHHLEHGAAIVSVELAPARGARAQDVLELQLAPASATTVLVLDGERPASGARLFLWQLVENHGANLAEERVTDAEGRVQLALLPHGSYAARAFGAGGRSGFVRVDLPCEPGKEWVLRLASSPEIVVTVAEKATGAPIPDARVRVSSLHSTPRRLTSVGSTAEASVHRTDAQGRCPVPIVDREPYNLSVAARAEGYEPLGWKSEIIARSQREVRIELEPLVTLSWPLAADEQPIPPDGTPVQFCYRNHGSWGEKPYSLASIQGGRLVVPRLERGDRMRPGMREGLAVLPDGSIGACRFLPSEREGEPVRFRRPRALTVRVLHADRRPAAGVTIAAEIGWTSGSTDRVATNEEGIARLVGFHGREVDVWASFPPRGSSWLIGNADLEAGDASLEHVLAEGREVDLLLRIGREPCLPAAFQVEAKDGRVEPIAEDAAAGRVRVRAYPLQSDRAIELSVSSKGYRTASTRLDPPHGAEPIRRELELLPSLGFRVRVLPPADGRYRLALHHHDARRRGWCTVFLEAREARDDHLLRFDDLSAGRYRVRDQLSGACSAEVEISDATAAIPPEIALDLSKAGIVEGRVICATDEPANIMVERRGTGLDPEEVVGEEDVLTRPIQGDGTFRFRVPGDRPVRLRAWHPTLIPDPERGEVEVVAPRTGIELVMVAGPQIRFEWPEDVAWDLVQVQVFRAPNWRVPLTTLFARREGTSCTAGGLLPGRYDFFVDAPRRAPLWLKDVEVAFPETNLGRLAFDRGASVRVRLPPPEKGRTAPRWHVSIVSWAGPFYSRNEDREAEAKEIVVDCLRVGQHTVTVSDGENCEQSFEVDLDGKSEVAIEVSAR